MSKVALIAESIKDEIKFIKQLREITGTSISEIRNSLKNKTPFYEGDDWEDEETIKKILHMIKRNKDSVLIVENGRKTPLEQFENGMKARHENTLDDLVDGFPIYTSIQCDECQQDTILRCLWERLGPCHGYEEMPYPGRQEVLDREFLVLTDASNDLGGNWTTIDAGNQEIGLYFCEEEDYDVLLEQLKNMNFQWTPT